MEDAKEVTAATADPAFWGEARGALHRQVQQRDATTQRVYGGDTTEAVEEVTAATADLATTQARGVSSRPWRVHNNSGKIGCGHV